MQSGVFPVIVLIFLFFGGFTCRSAATLKLPAWETAVTVTAQVNQADAFTFVSDSSVGVSPDLFFCFSFFN